MPCGRRRKTERQRGEVVPPDQPIFATALIPPCDAYSPQLFQLFIANDFRMNHRVIQSFVCGGLLHRGVLRRATVARHRPCFCSPQGHVDGMGVPSWAPGHPHRGEGEGYEPSRLHFGRRPCHPPIDGGTLGQKRRPAELQDGSRGKMMSVGAQSPSCSHRSPPPCRRS